MSKNSRNKMELWKLIVGFITAIIVVVIPILNNHFNTKEVPQFVPSYPSVSMEDKIILYPRNDAAKKRTDAHIEWDGLIFKNSAIFLKHETIEYTWAFSPKDVIKNKIIRDIGNHKLRVGFDNSDFSDPLNINITENVTTRVKLQNKGHERISLLLPNRPQKKLALIIGNAKYANAFSLRNPFHDAGLVAKNLEKIGFSVDLRKDLPRKELINIINNFSKKIGRNDIVIIYFSGHGVVVNGKSYILPVDAKISSALDVKYQGVSVDRLSRIVKGLKNKVIIYSTSPGSVASDGKGGNSPFAKSLAAFLIKGDELSSSFRKVISEVNMKTQGKQIPWMHSTASENIYLSLKNNKENLISASSAGVIILDTSRDNPYRNSSAR